MGDGVALLTRSAYDDPRGGQGQPCPLPGAKPFGKYYLLDRIGVGGMAEVFLAVAIGPQGFQRTLVIKRMLAHLSQDSAFVKMFIDEAKLCGLLSHPNLVQIFEFGQIDESFFIAMEHVAGRDVARRASEARRGGAHRARRRQPGDHAPGLPRAELRARAAVGDRSAARHRPPRRLAVEPDALVPRRREDPRLRDRPRHRGAARDRRPRPAR